MIRSQKLKAVDVNFDFSKNIDGKKSFFDERQMFAFNSAG